MRRYAVAFLLGAGGLLLTPAAPGVPTVPGDPTPPVVTPVIVGTLGDADWYTSNVTVNWTVVDPESIILSTSGCNAVTFTTNTTGTQLTCTAESDGGTTTVSKTFKVDKTAPTASATPSRAPDSNGWYNHNLTVAFTGTDTTSGLQSCTAVRTYAGPDGHTAAVIGTCRDWAGNTAPASLALQYDSTAPVVVGTPNRAADANGWYNHPFTVDFAGSDPTSGLDGCSAPQTYSGPDDVNALVSGSCRDRAGNSSTRSLALKYDQTAPQASAIPSRSADAGGWYNGPLTVSFAGADSTSGLESCAAPRTYAGPDSPAIAVAGTCVDRAGNGAAASFALKYDQTPPALGNLSTRPGNRRIQLRWTAAGTVYVEVRRAPGRNGEAETLVYRGSATTLLDAGLSVGRRYLYRVTGFDHAGNRADRSVAVTATGALLAPAPGARVTSPPRLRWTAVKGASYYNVQIVLGNRILSAWPAQPGFQVRRAWIYKGRRYRLRPGTYRWYVWPGFGRVTAARYGRLLGASTFVVRG